MPTPTDKRESTPTEQAHRMKLPLHASEGSPFRPALADANHVEICQCWDSANAAFICRSVNSHEQLLKALKDLKEALHAKPEERDRRLSDNTIIDFTERLKNAREAIALAESTP
jgi:hypothetical protein